MHGSEQSTEILTETSTEKPTEPKRWDDAEFDLGLGQVKFIPTGTMKTELHCHTVYDLIGVLMTEAAYTRSRTHKGANRTVDSYYARLASLHKYWCLRIDPDFEKASKRTMAAFHDTHLLLGRCRNT